MEGGPEHAAWAVAIQDSALGVLMRDSFVLYPIANLGHIFGLAFFVGSIALLDLRLLGIGRAVPLPALARLLNPIILGALALQIVSGALLFSADAGHVWDNPVFRIKIALIALGLVNAAWFRWRFGARYEGWDADPPAAGRAHAAISLFGWMLTAAAGRLIAYF
jgi:hypothetical protein